jgi:hypothetical protein
MQIYQEQVRMNFFGPQIIYLNLGKTEVNGGLQNCYTLTQSCINYNKT